MRKIKRAYVIMALVALLMVLGAVSMGVSAATEFTEGYFKYIVEGEHVTITGYFGAESEVVIYDYIASKPVTRIQGQIFKNNSKLTKVTVPETVTEIDDDLFLNIPTLKTVVVQSKSITVKVPAGCTIVEDYPIYIDPGLIDPNDPSGTRSTTQVTTPSVTTTPAPVTLPPAPVTTTPAPVTLPPVPVTTTPAPVTLPPVPVTTTTSTETTTPAETTTASVGFEDAAGDADDTTTAVTTPPDPETTTPAPVTTAPVTTPEVTTSDTVPADTSATEPSGTTPDTAQSDTTPSGTSYGTTPASESGTTTQPQTPSGDDSNGVNVVVIVVVAVVVVAAAVVGINASLKRSKRR